MLRLPAASDAYLTHRPFIAVYAGLPLVISLFYILGATTGPRNNYWWIILETRSNIWNVGGLGSCIASRTCPTTMASLAEVSASQKCLQYHFAVAPIVVICAALHHRLAAFQGSWQSLAARMIIPFMVLAVTLSSFLADILLVYTTFQSSPDVVSVTTKPSFWLATVGFAFALCWLAIADFYRRCKHYEYLLTLATPKKRHRRPPTTLEKVQSWWPWAK